MHTFLFLLWMASIVASPFVGRWLGGLAGEGKRWPPYAMAGWFVVIVGLAALQGLILFKVI